MEAKYNAAIKAGVIGGVLLAICAIISLIIGLFPALSCLAGLCLFILVIVIALGTGALAVMYATGTITKLVDAIVVSAVAGAVAGVIYAVVQVVIAFIQPFLNIGEYSYTSDIGSILAGNAIGSAAGGMFTCICAPVTVVIVIILAIIGGAIYGLLKLKLA